MRCRAGCRLLAAAALAVGPTGARADGEVVGLAVATGIAVVAAMGQPAREEPDRIALEAGGFDVVKNVQPAGAFGVEYRVGQHLWWKLRPFAGGGLTTDHGFYGYGGIRLATYWGERVVATPSFAIGGYSRGSGKDLGNPPVVGRFGIDLAYRCDDGVRIGVAYHHMSNGKVLGQTTNPGTEVVGATLSVPLR